MAGLNRWLCSTITYLSSKMQIVQLPSGMAFTRTCRLHLHCLIFTLRGIKWCCNRFKSAARKKVPDEKWVQTVCVTTAGPALYTLVSSPERLSAPLAGKWLHGVEPSKREVLGSLLRCCCWVFVRFVLFCFVLLCFLKSLVKELCFGRTLNGLPSFHAS